MMQEAIPALGYKYAARATLEASGMEWTYVICGFFVETTVSTVPACKPGPCFRTLWCRPQFSPFFHIDVPGRGATRSTQGCGPMQPSAQIRALAPAAGGKALLKGDTKTPFALSSLVDVGIWTAAALLQPASKVSDTLPAWQGYRHMSRLPCVLPAERIGLHQGGVYQL
jgi:hypothetical protein